MIWEGARPLDAYVETGFDPYINNAATVSEDMAKSAWCRSLQLSWATDPKDQVQSAINEAIALLVEGLADRKEGRVTNLAVRCAENLLDRGGIVRSQVVQQTQTEDAGTQDAKTLIKLIKTRMKELEGPISKPPALEAISRSNGDQGQ